jgi:hypothetical protein
MVAYLLFELDLHQAGTSLLEQKEHTGRTMNDLLTAIGKAPAD